mgnify:CR=1 FL=1|jgi:nucleoside phosphorylase
MSRERQRNPRFRLGMVVALPGEAQAMLGRRDWVRHGELDLCSVEAPVGAEILWVRCGIGCERAAAAAALLVERGATHIGIAGVSGGLDPELTSGRVVIATDVVDENGRHWPVDFAFSTALADRFGKRGKLGPVLTATKPLLSVEHKAFWHEHSGALAVDMESVAVARVAATACRPFFAMRAVCDAAGRAVPEAMLAMVDDFGRPRILKLLCTLLRRPWLAGPLLRMQGDFHRALRGLADGWPACRSLFAIDFDQGRKGYG